LVSLIPYFSGVNITRITPFFVGAAGYFLGIWAGTGASLAAIVIHTLVFNSLGYEGPFAIAQVKPAAHVGIVLIGPLTGRLRSITLRLQREAAGREAAELELRDSESRLRQIVDTIREAFWIRSADQSRTVYVSPAFESIFGITSDKIENNPRAILEIVHPDDRERLEEKITSIPENDYQLQYRIKRLDGAVRWIQTRAFVVRDEEGKAQRIAGVSISSRRFPPSFTFRTSILRFRLSTSVLRSSFYSDIPNTSGCRNRICLASCTTPTTPTGSRVN
jgi:PAS domain S-box-containing protein